MNENKKENKKENKELNRSSKSFDKKRRSFTKAGVTVPVILTLASQPVFGIPCLSEAMSGNLSHPGNSCGLGAKPKEWKKPGGTIGDVNTVEAWSAAGFDYSDGAPPRKRGNKCKNYDGGITFSDAFGSGENAPMREIMCGKKNKFEKHLITAILNAGFFSSYPLSVKDVKKIYDGNFPLLSGANKREINTYLAATWS